MESPVDVTNHLKQMARADVRVRLNYRTFGVDPDMGHAKVPRIYARGPGGREKMFQYRDNSIIDGTKFRGWGRGEWAARMTAGAVLGSPLIPLRSGTFRHYDECRTSTTFLKSNSCLPINPENTFA
jgi:hypothetical protein